MLSYSQNGLQVMGISLNFRMRLINGNIGGQELKSEHFDGIMKCALAQVRQISGVYLVARIVRDRQLDMRKHYYMVYTCSNQIAT